MFSVVSLYDLSFNLYCNDCYEYDVRYYTLSKSYFSASCSQLEKKFLLSLLNS